MEETTNERLQLIKLLIEFETAIERLYKEFARKLPDSATHWAELAVDERTHASMLESLKKRVVAERTTPNSNPGIFVKSQVVSATDTIQEKRMQMAQQGIVLNEALYIALKTEESIIENGFYRVVDEDGPEITRVFKDMSRCVDNHVQRLLDFCKQNK